MSLERKAAKPPALATATPTNVPPPPPLEADFAPTDSIGVGADSDTADLGSRLLPLFFPLMGRSGSGGATTGSALGFLPSFFPFLSLGSTNDLGSGSILP